MTTWVLETVGLFATTLAALLTVLHLHRTSRQFAEMELPPACAVLRRDRRLLMITMTLMAGWFLVQYVGLILL